MTATALIISESKKLGQQIDRSRATVEVFAFTAQENLFEKIPGFTPVET